MQAWWSCRIRRQARVLFYSACQDSVYRYGISTTGGNFQVASWANGTINRVRQTPFLGAIGELASIKAQPCLEAQWLLGHCATTKQQPWGRYHGSRQPSSDDSPTIIPPSTLDKPSIMKRYHRQRTCSHTSPCCSLTMVMLHDTRFVEC